MGSVDLDELFCESVISNTAMNDVCSVAGR